MWKFLLVCNEVCQMILIQYFGVKNQVKFCHSKTALFEFLHNSRTLCTAISTIRIFFMQQLTLISITVNIYKKYAPSLPQQFVSKALQQRYVDTLAPLQSRKSQENSHASSGSRSNHTKRKLCKETMAKQAKVMQVERKG